MPWASWRRWAIAALAVLVEDEASGKKRVIHDGTHDIGVNNRIKCKDKVRMPGPREKRAILEEMEQAKEVVMALVGDFEKAHRRFLYQEKERGLLARKVRDGDPHIYLNKVGTFGIRSAPYWCGWVTEWVGLCTDYKSFSMGLSERRAEWLCGWMRSLEERKEVTDIEFAAGLGRLSFASLALPWERPLLGPFRGSERMQVVLRKG